MDKSGTSHVAKALVGSSGARQGELARGFRLGRWQVRPAFCSLTDDTRTEQLEPKVMAVLLCLAQHAPQPVTREQFIGEVWDGRTVTDEVLSRSVSLLRSHLGDDTHAPRFIQTIPRIGYALIPPVERLDVSSPGGPGVSGSGVEARAAESLDPALPIRLAVLPFANASRDPDTDYFVEGLGDELAASLSRVDGLHVVARTSALRFKEHDKNAREIGQMLGATHLVEGSVRSDGQRLHIGVQLVNAQSGQGIWAGTYDRETQDVFAMQAEIASAIAQSLARRPPATLATSPRPPSWNLEAYQSYLRGQQQLKRRGAVSIRASIDLFREAVALDPQLAAAHVALAFAYTLLPSYTPVDATMMYANADSALAEATRNSRLTVSGAQVKTASPGTQFLRGMEVAILDLVRILLNERIGVLREAARRGDKQALMPGRALQQTLNQLETEGNGGADEFRVIVRRICRASAGQRVADLVHRESLDRASGCRANGQQRDQ